MDDNIYISIYLDTRRAKKSGKYPVKLRVFDSNIKRQKLYSTEFEFTIKEFEGIWNTQKPRKENKQFRLEMQALEKRANDLVKEFKVFSFEDFERKMNRKKGEGSKLAYHYKQRISTLKRENRLSTASSYECSENCLREFTEHVKNQKYQNLTFLNITPQWLNDFEEYMIDRGRSINTVGIYLRPLRAIYNKAINEKEIENEIYPFGKRKYQIPSSNNVKKALSLEQVGLLFNSTPRSPQEERAKDFWFLSFSCNGMNIKDLAHLTNKDVSDDKIVFYRAKTKRSTKSNLKPITVYRNNFINEIIVKYGKHNDDPNEYVFDILQKGLSAEKQHLKIQNFTRFINKHVKRLCKANDLPEISTYWARHTFATVSIRKGASLEFMQESLGHKTMATTLNYFAGFDDESKKDFAESLMEF